MSDEITFVVEQSAEGGYEAQAIGHALSTHAETLDKLKKMVQVAVLFHFADDIRPRIVKLHMVQEELFAV